MGMFDDIRCELPIGALAGTRFQTKSLECLMETYTITAEGRLIQHTCDMEPVPKEERPIHAADSLIAIFGMVRVVPGSRRDVDTEFDGDVTFYAKDTFRATFRAGDCVDVCKFVGRKWRQVWQKETTDAE